jgi:DNA primase
MVNYKELKERVSLTQVCERYGVIFKPSGAQVAGDCPLCGSSGFKVSTEKGAFKCFGCGAGGNILDLVALKEKVSVKRASELIDGWFPQHLTTLQKLKKLFRK